MNWQELQLALQCGLDDWSKTTWPLSQSGHLQMRFFVRENSQVG